MPLLTIREIPDPVLRRVAAPVEAVGPDTRRLIEAMFETMYAAPGIGLAAPQVGVLDRVLVMDVGPDDEAGERVREPRVFINPELLWASDELSIYNEGCLSIPDQYGEIERPARVRARWLDADGTAHEAGFDGLAATCLQHEIDHLNGVLFIDHLSRLKRSMLLKRLDKQRREAA